MGLPFGLGSDDDYAPEYAYQNYDDREIRIKSEAGKYLRSQVLTISKNEISFSITSKYTVKVDDKLKLEFILPGGRQIAWTGKVAAVQTFESPQLPGVKNWKAVADFDPLPEEHVGTIQASIEKANEKLDEIMKRAAKRAKKGGFSFGAVDAVKIAACVVAAGMLVGGGYIAFKEDPSQQARNVASEKSQERAQDKTKKKEKNQKTGLISEAMKEELADRRSGLKSRKGVAKTITRNSDVQKGEQPQQAQKKSSEDKSAKKISGLGGVIQKKNNLRKERSNFGESDETGMSKAALVSNASQVVERAAQQMKDEKESSGGFIGTIQNFIGGLFGGSEDSREPASDEDDSEEKKKEKPKKKKHGRLSKIRLKQ